MSGQRQQLGMGMAIQSESLRNYIFLTLSGLLYSAFTYYTGFRVNSGEYKLMGLAPYGNPDSEQTKAFKRKIIDELIDIREDGSLLLNMEYFDFATGLKMTNDKKWHELFGIPPRAPGIRNWPGLYEYGACHPADHGRNCI